MMIAGQCTPHFLFFFAKKKRKRAVHGPKEKKTLWREFDPWSNFANMRRLFPPGLGENLTAPAGARRSTQLKDPWPA